MTDRTDDRVGRWPFLFKSLAASGLAVAGPWRALLARWHGGHDDDDHPKGTDYGPLFPVADGDTGLPLLLLPEGFRYVSFGWTRDPLADGSPTPPAHDGMAALRSHGETLLVRNHEVSTDRGVFAPGHPTYDPAASGGTTTLEFDTRRGRFVRAWASLTGTRTNCAGGPTPWDSWLTCEETLAEPIPGGNLLTRPHGYVFEVPADDEATGEPIVAMGRFVHEAVAVDPRAGVLYLTEDRSTAGFYRFLPRHHRKLARGGRLQMLGVQGQPNTTPVRGRRRGRRCGRSGSTSRSRTVPTTIRATAAASSGRRTTREVPFSHGWRAPGTAAASSISHPPMAAMPDRVKSGPTSRASRS